MCHTPMNGENCAFNYEQSDDYCDECYKQDEMKQCEDCGERRLVFIYPMPPYDYYFCIECIIARWNHPRGLNPKLLSLEEILGI